MHFWSPFPALFNDRKQYGLEDKQRIREIIAKKYEMCDRQNFEFYQTEKYMRTGKVVIFKDNLRSCHT